MSDRERCMSYGRGGAGNLRKPTDVAQAKQTMAAMGITDTEEVDTSLLSSSPTTTTTSTTTNPIAIPNRPSHDTDFYIHLRRHQPRSRASSRPPSPSQSEMTDTSSTTENVKSSLSRSGSTSSSLSRSMSSIWKGLSRRVGREDRG